MKHGSQFMSFSGDRIGARIWRSHMGVTCDNEEQHKIIMPAFSISKRIKWAIISIFILAFLLFGVLPRAAEMHLSRVLEGKLIPISDQARKLHDDLFIADLHADSLLFGRDLTMHAHRGHLDLPRIRKGGMNLQAFSVVTKTPRGINYEKNPSDTDNITLVAFFGLWPPRTWFSLRERALYQAGRLKKMADDPDNHFMMVRSVADLNEFQKRQENDPTL